MYHVTNILKDDSPDHPKWTEIRLSVADDKTYNGELVRLLVASFTTTLYNGNLPTCSPYPRCGEKNKCYWRVKIPFEYDKYNMFIMNAHHKQIQLLCLTKDGIDESTDVENILATEIIKERHLKDKDVLKYFPNGQPNDYRNKKWFVNLFFIKPIKIPNGSQWDKVKRNHHKYGDLETITEADNIVLLDKWGMALVNKLGMSELKSKWCKAIELFKNSQQAKEE